MTRLVSLFLLVVCASAPTFGQCPGDCSGDGEVTVNELITAVSISLGSALIARCLVADLNADDALTIDELITSVFNALNGCPIEQPTFTRTPPAEFTATPTPTATATGVALQGSCPTGFEPQEGENRGFPSDGKERWFHVLLPDAVAAPAGAAAAPRPLFVSLTGTVQSELGFAAQSRLDQLPADGWIVAAPVRTCSQNMTNCAQLGTDGRLWEPWWDAPRQGGPSDDEGPDVRFVEAMVRCIATRWPVDANRIYIGGISAGGSFTNRSMTFNSDFFAGGVASSGNWYGGLAAPRSPLEMDRSLVIVIWGGPDDVWPANNPIADYNPETRLASMYYAAQPNVVTVSCTGNHGHIWPSDLTAWLAETLLSHPKGTDSDAFVLTDPPAGFSCVIGEYTDH